MISANNSQNTQNFANNLEHFGEAVALTLPDGMCISYQKLAALCDEFGKNFIRFDIPSHHLCALQFSIDLNTVVAYLACLRQQRPVLLLDPDLPQTQLKVVLERLHITALIDTKGHINKLRPIGHQTRADLALLLSTSGSSGSPKSVMLSLDNLQANALSISRYLPIQASDTAITVLPLHYSYGLSVLNSHLLIGAKILLCPFSLITKEFWQLMEQYQVNSFAGVPLNYHILKTLRFERKQLTHLRYLTQAGGKLNSSLTEYMQQLATTLQKPVYLMYGQTEATARIAYLPPELIQQHADCIGVAIPEGELLLRDPVSKTLITEDLVQGELCYRGPNVMLGYANCAADLNSDTVLTELSTGDLAERLSNGLYRIVGRLSRFLKLQGKRLQLDHLEQQLATFTEPVCCAGTDEVLIVAHTHQSAEVTAQMQQYLREQLQLHPSLFNILTLDTLPVLTNGKADYQALLKLALEMNNAN